MLKFRVRGTLIFYNKSYFPLRQLCAGADSVHQNIQLSKLTALPARAKQIKWKVVLTEGMLRSVLQSVKKILISNSSVLLSPCFHQTWNVSIMWSRDCFPTLSNVLSYIHWSRYKKSEDSTQNSILTKQYIMSSLPSRISHTNVLPWPLVSDALFKHC